MSSFPETLRWKPPGFWNRLVERVGIGAAICRALAADLADPAAPAALLDEAEKRLGAPSILINNAAHSTNDGFERLMTPELGRELLAPVSDGTDRRAG